MVNSMTERNLSRLYQRLSTQCRLLDSDLLDADTLVAASAGELSGDRRDEVASRLSRSPAQTDLVRMLHELGADSTALANAVRQQQGLAHAREGRRTRHAGHAHRQAKTLRWAGLAACLMLVVGFVFWHPMADNSANGVMATTAKPDRIFTSKDRIFSMTDVPAAHGAIDGVFHSDFNDG
jgi:hypothetical protein